MFLEILGGLSLFGVMISYSCRWVFLEILFRLSLFGVIMMMMMMINCIIIGRCSWRSWEACLYLEWWYHILVDGCSWRSWAAWPCLEWWWLTRALVGWRWRCATSPCSQVSDLTIITTRNIMHCSCRVLNKKIIWKRFPYNNFKGF